MDRTSTRNEEGGEQRSERGVIDVCNFTRQYGVTTDWLFYGPRHEGEASELSLHSIGWVCVPAFRSSVGLLSFGYLFFEDCPECSHRPSENGGSHAYGIYTSDWVHARLWRSLFRFEPAAC
jgi:hypothetical protein